MTNLQIDFWDTSYVQIGGQLGYPRMSPTYPPVVIPNTAQIGMIDKWVKVSASFTALGGEKSFVLGYLSDYFRTAPMPITQLNKNNDAYAYYFFDDFSLTPYAGSPIERKMPSRPIIYFDVDKAVIKPEFFAPL